MRQAPNPLAWTFGERIRKVRRLNGLTQKAFAEMIGASPASVDAWEADRNRPRDLVAVAEQIEATFNLPRGWMLGYADDLPAQRKGAGALVTGEYGGLRVIDGGWQISEPIRPALHLVRAA